MTEDVLVIGGVLIFGDTIGGRHVNVHRGYCYVGQASIRVSQRAKGHVQVASR